MCEVSDPLLRTLAANFRRAAVADKEAALSMARAERLFARLSRHQSEETAYDAAGVGLADRRCLRAHRAMTAALEALRLNQGRATTPERISVMGMVLVHRARLRAVNQNKSQVSGHYRPPQKATT